MSQAILYGTVVIERDEPKPPRSSCFLVHHQSGVKNCSELFEILLEFFFNNILTDSAYKYLGCFILFLTGNGTLRINLYLAGA